MLLYFPSDRTVVRNLQLNIDLFSLTCLTLLVLWCGGFVRVVICRSCFCHNLCMVEGLTWMKGNSFSTRESRVSPGKEEGGREERMEREEERKTGCKLRKCYHLHSFAFSLRLWSVALSSSLLSVTVDVSSTSSSLAAW